MSCGSLIPSLRGGLEIDRELDLRELLDGQVCGRRAPEDAVDVARAGSPERREIDAVREERSLLDPLLAVPLDR